MRAETPLLDALIESTSRNTVPMHMPGHKRNSMLGLNLHRLYSMNVLHLDFTEIEGLDELHYPSGVIREAEQAAARCFGSKHSFFLVNGCTAGIHAAMMACCREGDAVAVPRNAHRAVYEGLLLTGARPEYYLPEVSQKYGLPQTPSRENFQRFLEEKDLKAAVFVHPTYHGAACDPLLIRMARKKGCRVIADEAHGAHFPFDSRLPSSSLREGADYVIHGTHKTLGSLTQTGILHVGTEDENALEVQHYLAVLQSTSPSYVLLASIDAMRADMESRGPELVGRAVDLSLELREGIKGLAGIECVEFSPYPGYDMTKVLLYSSRGYGGKELATYLQCAGVIPEMVDDKYVLMMVTVGDTKNGVASVLDALARFNEHGSRNADRSEQSAFELDRTDMFRSLPIVDMTPREAVKHSWRSIPLCSAIGEVSGAAVVPYPPGIPLIFPGEKITSAAVDGITAAAAQGFRVQGLEENMKIRVLEM